MVIFDHFISNYIYNRELSRQRGNMFGMQNFPVTQTPFIDPDLYADMMEGEYTSLTVMSAPMKVIVIESDVIVIDSDINVM